MSRVGRTLFSPEQPTKAFRSILNYKICMTVREKHVWQMHFGVCASLEQTPEIMPAVRILGLGFPETWKRVVSLRLNGRSWTPESLVCIYKITPRHIPEDSSLCIFIYLRFTWGRVKFAFHIIDPYGAVSSTNWSVVGRVLPCEYVCVCVQKIHIYIIVYDQETSTMSRPRAELCYCLIRPHALNTFRIVEV